MAEQTEAMEAKVAEVEEVAEGAEVAVEAELAQQARRVDTVQEAAQAGAAVSRRLQPLQLPTAQTSPQPTACPPRPPWPTRPLTRSAAAAAAEEALVAAAVVAAAAAMSQGDRRGALVGGCHSRRDLRRPWRSSVIPRARVRPTAAAAGGAALWMLRQHHRRPTSVGDARHRRCTHPPRNRLPIARLASCWACREGRRSSCREPDVRLPGTEVISRALVLDAADLEYPLPPLAT